MFDFKLLSNRHVRFQNRDQTARFDFKSALNRYVRSQIEIELGGSSSVRALFELEPGGGENHSYPSYGLRDLTLPMPAAVLARHHGIALGRLAALALALARLAR